MFVVDLSVSCQRQFPGESGCFHCHYQYPQQVLQGHTYGFKFSGRKDPTGINVKLR
jgi:hypothetical protein